MSTAWRWILALGIPSIIATVIVGWFFSSRRGPESRLSRQQAKEGLAQREEALEAERRAQEESRRRAQEEENLRHDYDLMRRALLKELQSGRGTTIKLGRDVAPGGKPRDWNMYWLSDGDFAMKASRSDGGSGSRSGSWIWKRGEFPRSHDEMPPSHEKAMEMLKDFRFERLLAADLFPEDPLRIPRS